MSYHNNIQFTELTPDDIAIHEDLYIEVLISDSCLRNEHKYFNIYREYAVEEVLKGKSLFQKTFG